MMTKYEFTEDLVRNHSDKLQALLVAAIQPNIYSQLEDKFTVQVELSKNYIFQMVLMPEQHQFDEAITWLFTKSKTKFNTPCWELYALYYYCDKELEQYEPLFSTRIQSLFFDVKRVIEPEDVFNNVTANVIKVDKEELARRYMYFQLTQILDSAYSFYEDGEDFFEYIANN